MLQFLHESIYFPLSTYVPTVYNMVLLSSHKYLWIIHARKDIVFYKCTWRKHTIFIPSYYTHIRFSYVVETILYIMAERGTRILLKVKRSIYDVTHAVVNIVFGMNLRSSKGYAYMLVMISFYWIHYWKIYFILYSPLRKWYRISLLFWSLNSFIMWQTFYLQNYY